MLTVNSFLIGADPECVVVNKAGEHVNVKPFTVKDADVAWDHEGDVLELKPKPAKSTYRLIRRMRKLILLDAVSKDLIGHGYKFRGGAHFKTPKRIITLGGHVHFGLPFATTQHYNDYYDGNGDNMSMNLFTKDNQERVKALDRLTVCLENLDILPKEESKHRRKVGQNYGKLGAVRCANDDNHWEYRSMCSWLHSPVSAFICLTSAKLAAFHPDSITAEFKEVKDLKELFEKFKSKDLDAARAIEMIFERKIPLEAQVDLSLQDTWKSLKKLGGIEGLCS